MVLEITKKMNWAEKVTNGNVMIQVGETRSILTIIKRPRWDTFCHDEESHYTVIEGAMEGRKSPG